MSGEAKSQPHSKTKIARQKAVKGLKLFKWSRENGGKSGIKKSRKLRYLRDKWRE